MHLRGIANLSNRLTISKTIFFNECFIYPIDETSVLISEIPMPVHNEIDIFFESNPLWLAQFEPQGILAKLFALCSNMGVYLLDSKQNVIFWNDSAEVLTGIKKSDILHKVCMPELAMQERTDLSDLAPAVIELARPSSQPPSEHIRLIRQAWILRDAQQQFAGVLGRFEPLPAHQHATQMPHGLAGATKVSAPNKQVFQGIISRSPAMEDVFHIIKNAAETASTVLVRGESGAGKELVAKAIHDLSIRREQPFLAINCAALSSNLLESELFGHMRGAFTGAIKDHIGLFQRAQGGTLFLDEVAELPLDLQAKLLRVIQERNFIPVGGAQQINTDVRIVAATHRSLREEVKQGRFREDLMYRLRVVPIFIPPLRERREDINLLIWHFIRGHNAENFRQIEKIEPQAMRALLDYQWPGNVRELHNVVEYAFAVGRGNVLRYSELPPEFLEPQRPLPKPSTSKLKKIPLEPEQEMTAISQALSQHHGLITPAADSLGMSRATFWRKRKLYGL